MEIEIYSYLLQTLSTLHPCSDRPATAVYKCMSFYKPKPEVGWQYSLLLHHLAKQEVINMSGQEASFEPPIQYSDSGLIILILGLVGITLLVILTVVCTLCHWVKYKRRQALRQLDIRIHRLHVQRTQRLSASTADIHTTTTTTDIRRTQSVPHLRIPQYLDIIPTTPVTLNTTFRQSKRYSYSSEWDYVNQFDGPPYTSSHPPPSPPPFPPHYPRSPSPPQFPPCSTPNLPPSAVSSFNSSMPPSLFSPWPPGEKPLPMVTSGWSLDS